MKHLQEVFDTRIRYVCISSPRNPSPNSCAVYIQIIFDGVVSKKDYFMKRVADLYLVDYNIRMFLGHSL
jgi:hypothetical protein